MEWFVTVWPQAAAVFAPCALWLLAQKVRQAPLPLGTLARVGAVVSGGMLVLAAISAAAEAFVGLLF
jgi:hypothetical protein